MEQENNSNKLLDMKKVEVAVKIDEIEKERKVLKRLKSNFPKLISGEENFNNFLKSYDDIMKLSRVVTRFISLIKFLDMFGFNDELEKIKSGLSVHGIKINEEDFGEIHKEYKKDRGIQELFKECVSKEDFIKETKQEIEDVALFLEDDIKLSKSDILKIFQIYYKSQFKSIPEDIEIAKIQNDINKKERMIDLI